jgi:GNAT superfamily N-acetyltransferase
MQSKSKEYAMNDIVIRPARPEDTEAVITVAKEAWSRIYEGYRTQLGDEVYELFFPNALEKKAEAVKANVASGTCFVTELCGRVVGFIHYIFSEKEQVGTISHNAVLLEARGHGIAGRQYARVFEALKELGAVGVRVQTGLDDAHAPARRAYEKAGFSRHTDSITYYKKL